MSARPRDGDDDADDDCEFHCHERRRLLLQHHHHHRPPSSSSSAAAEPSPDFRQQPSQLRLSRLSARPQSYSPSPVPPARSSDASLETASHVPSQPAARHSRYRSRHQSQSRRYRSPSSDSTNSSSATLVSAYSPPPFRAIDYRYMATPSSNGLFKDYEVTSDDELPTHHRPQRGDSRNWQQHRPLIENVTNEWQKNTHDPDPDDDDDFYYSDKQNWYTPAIVTLVAAQRIPRRIQRAILTVVVATVLLLFSWSCFLGPLWTEQTNLSEALVGPQKYGSYGANARPAFTDMVQVKTLDPSLLPTTSADRQRLVIVGDVHGCKSELVELLNKIDFRPAADHLVLTGDIIAKGPDSPAVVDFARDVRASCVRGNHEDRILLSRKAMKVAEQDMDNNSHLGEDEARNGGNKKDKELAKKFNAKQIEWLEQCPVILRIGQIKGMGEVLVAHGGLVPGVDLDRHDPFQVMNMRTIDLDTKVPSAERDGTPWYKYWNYYMKYLPEDKRSTVIYGHDAKTGLKIKKYSKGLDSGCVKGGKLTALVIEADPKGGPAKQSLVHVSCSGYVAEEEDSKKKR